MLRSIKMIKHPLIQHKLHLLRDKNTNHIQFKQLVYELTLLLAYESSKCLQTETVKIETPLMACDAEQLSGKSPVILPILRAGLGMVEGFLTVMPMADVGHIGIFRDEASHEPQHYYFKIPEDHLDRHFFICDPMLATGGTAVATIDRLKKMGITRMSLTCIVAAPEGAATVHKAHPDVPVTVASIDKQLNENAYIIPGLGDAGDRLFGTK